MDALGISRQEASLVVVSATLIYLAIIAIIALSRMVGLRSFAQMSSFDLATTVAVGSILGRVTLVDTSVAAGALIEPNLKRARINAEDVYARIRSGGYGRLDEVTAVIMERTGQMSVITSRDIEGRLFSGVRGRELLGIDADVPDRDNGRPFEEEADDA